MLQFAVEKNENEQNFELILINNNNNFNSILETFYSSNF